MATGKKSLFKNDIEIFEMFQRLPAIKKLVLYHMADGWFNQYIGVEELPENRELDSVRPGSLDQ